MGSPTHGKLGLVAPDLFAQLMVRSGLPSCGENEFVHVALKGFIADTNNSMKCLEAPMTCPQSQRIEHK